MKSHHTSMLAWCILAIAVSALMAVKANAADVTVTIFSTSSYLLDGDLEWRWEGIAEKENKRVFKGFYYSWTWQKFSSCSGAYQGFLNSVDRVWFDREKITWEVKAPCGDM